MILGAESGHHVGGAVGPEGHVEFWHETVAVDLPWVTYDTFSREVRTGRETRTREVLVFRPLEQIETSLRRAGLTPVTSYGDGDRSPVGEGAPELIVVAGACQRHRGRSARGLRPCNGFCASIRSRATLPA